MIFKEFFNKKKLPNSELQSNLESDLYKILETVIDVGQTNCSLFIKNRIFNIKNIQQNELLSLMEISYNFSNKNEKILNKKLNSLKGFQSI
jgi:hypothetical protein